jgi:hypothetical protein
LKPLRCPLQADFAVESVRGVNGHNLRAIDN